jgi:hypothetical protein
MFREIFQIRKSRLASPRRYRSQHQSHRRVCSFEALEKRQLLSVDLVPEPPAGLGMPTGCTDTEEVHACEPNWDSETQLSTKVYPVADLVLPVSSNTFPDPPVGKEQDIHEEIVDLLAKLRRLQEPEVTIEARLITRNDNFFERNGVDFDFEVDDNNIDSAVRANSGFAILSDIEAFFFLNAAQGDGRSESSAEEGMLDEPNDQSRRASDPTVTGSGTSVRLPTVATISVQTIGNVPDGGTAVLGGIKWFSEGRNERGVPMLSKLPYISRLFKNEGISRETQSLLMAVTPRIIIQEEEENRGPSSLPEAIHLANDDSGPNSIKEPESDGDEVHSQAFDIEATVSPTDNDIKCKRVISADRRYK